MRLLITGAWKHNEEQLEQIKQLGHSITFIQNEDQKLPIEYDKIEGVICNALFVYHDIKRFTCLRYIQLTSAGFDRVPIDYIQNKSIELHNAKGVYSIPMAEYAIGGILQLYKQSLFFEKNKQLHVWLKNRELLELCGKTVCIVGCGSVGTECAKRFLAFDCFVVGVDLVPREDPLYTKIFSIDDLNKAIAISDIIILTLPLDNFSKHLIRDEQLAIMKSKCIIVNISRGAIIDTVALMKYLMEKKLMAVLDVFEEEPLNVDSPLWSMDNVIITPHNSFVGENNELRLWKVIFENLKKFTKQVRE